MSRREELKRRLDARKRKRRKRQSQLALLVLLLLLLLISRCTCVEETVPQGGGVPEPPVAEEPAPPAEPLPQREKIPPLKRPAFKTPPVDPLPWLPAFRLQATARSPRLADCFVGAERPGRLRWTAAVDPVRGQVSEQRIEPVSAWDTLSADQSDCVKGVLAEPAYTLDPEDGPTTPSRVSMVIEF